MMGNLGSELSRAQGWQKKGKREYFLGSMERCMAIVDELIAQEAHRPAVRELTLLRECLNGAYIGQEVVALSQLISFCMPFALAARRRGSY